MEHPLTTRRRQKTLSMQDLADLSCMDKVTIWKIENRKVDNPWPRTMRALAKALDCEPSDLMELHD